MSSEKLQISDSNYPDILNLGTFLLWTLGSSFSGYISIEQGLGIIKLSLIMLTPWFGTYTKNGIAALTFGEFETLSSTFISYLKIFLIYITDIET